MTVRGPGDFSFSPTLIPTAAAVLIYSDHLRTIVGHCRAASLLLATTWGTACCNSVSFIALFNGPHSRSPTVHIFDVRSHFVCTLRRVTASANNLEKCNCKSFCSLMIRTVLRSHLGNNLLHPSFATVILFYRPIHSIWRDL